MYWLLRRQPLLHFTRAQLRRPRFAAKRVRRHPRRNSRCARRVVVRMQYVRGVAIYGSGGAWAPTLRGKAAAGVFKPPNARRAAEARPIASGSRPRPPAGATAGVEGGVIARDFGGRARAEVTRCARGRNAPTFPLRTPPCVGGFTRFMTLGVVIISAPHSCAIACAQAPRRASRRLLKPLARVCCGYRLSRGRKPSRRLRWRRFGRRGGEAKRASPSAVGKISPVGMPNAIQVAGRRDARARRRVRRRRVA